MRIRPDLDLPDLAPARRENVRFRGLIYLAFVFLGLVLGSLVGGWMLERAERAGALDVTSLYVVGGWLWGGTLGAIVGGLVVAVMSARGGTPSWRVGKRLLAWMGFWWLAALWFGGLHEGCLAEACHQFVDDGRRILLILETAVIASSVAAFLLFRSAPQRWLAFGVGAIISPALILGALPLVPPTGIEDQAAPPGIPESPATALGNVEIRFLTPGEPPKVLEPLTLQMLLRRPNLFVSQAHSIRGSKGAFGLALNPGVYVVDGLFVRARGLGKTPIRLSPPPHPSRFRRADAYISVGWCFPT
jgi:hypothetical protein